MTTNFIQSNNSGIMKLLYQSYLPGIINCAIEINVFEALSQNPLQLSELSQRLKTVEPLTEALLDVLIAAELADRHENKYSLTQTGKDFFLSGSAASLVGVTKGFFRQCRPL